MSDQTTPAVEWQDDPDVISWDWREQPDLNQLSALLGRHGVTLTEVDTGTDQYAIRIGSAQVEVLEDDLCRRVWAAALRWESGQLQPGQLEGAGESGYYAACLEIDAHRIESGALTPWADSPEPATCEECGLDLDSDAGCRHRPCPRLDRPPARETRTCDRGPIGDPCNICCEPAEDHARAELPADPDPHPATPDSVPGILGRALLDADGNVWQDWGSGVWAAAGERQAYDTEVITVYGGREVLLVAPAAARVIQAAREWVARTKAPGASHPNLWADDEDFALIAAVDALTGGQRLTWSEAAEQAQADTERAEARRTALAEREARPFDAAAIAEALKAGNVACVQTIDRDLQAFAELPDCTHCDGSGKQVPPGWRGAPAACGALVRHTDIDGTDMEPCGNPLPCPWHPAEGAPGLPFPVVADPSVPPDTLLMVGTTQDERGEQKLTGAKLTGPGWDREVVQLVISSMHDGPVERARAYQLRALLADRDERERERDHSDAVLKRAAADMAQMQVERDWLQVQLAEHLAAVNRLTAERDTARTELANVRERLASIQRQRDSATNALAEVTADRNTARHNLSLMVEDHRKLRAELATARRDTAAATLDEAADLAGLDSSTVTGGILRQWATEIRDGKRDTPGSPEQGGGQYG